MTMVTTTAAMLDEVEQDGHLSGVEAEAGATQDLVVLRQDARVEAEGQLAGASQAHDLARPAYR